MSRTITSTATVASRPRRSPIIERIARAGVHRSLAHLREGRLMLSDGEGTRTFGQRDESTPLSAGVFVEGSGFYPRALLGGSLGAAEAYIAGLWSCDDLVDVLRLFARNMDALDEVESGPARVAIALARVGQTLCRNSRTGSRRNIVAHYDLGNDFFRLFLDDTMTYSCGLFERPHSTLEEASVAKLDRLCRKLRLGPDDHLLEIGSGWGSMAIHAASRYGCRVTTTTISSEQHELATRRVVEAGLSDLVTVLLADYRDLRGTYDKIVSIEMIEAVGHKYLDTYFGQCGRLLKPGGLMALQAITMPDQRYDRYLRSADFIQKYVFPGSCVPSLGAITGAVGRATDLQIVALEDITAHYVMTLREWRRRFTERLDDVRSLGYPETFIRLWEFYLCYCEAGFAERVIGDVQIVLAGPEHGRAESGR